MSGGGGVASHEAKLRPAIDAGAAVQWRPWDLASAGVRLAVHATPGVGFGIGGLMAELQLHLAAPHDALDPSVALAAGVALGGSGRFVVTPTARLAAGARWFAGRRLFLKVEVEGVLTRFSIAGLGIVGAGYSF
ncbi:MAG: hypothetical protein HY903_19835 [Deltaproteobacteria bacterium]|nr:hypothetical protein [Deltaproteobacteria bacterium]